MLSYDTEILTILQPRFHEQELHGYYGSLFSPDKTKFVAYTYVRLDTIDFQEYSFTLTNGGHSSIGADREKSKKYLESGSYQMKSSKECIEEGIYTAYSIKFCGVFYEGEWFVENELSFFGQQLDEERAKAYLSVRYSYPDLWNTGSFGEGWAFNIPGTNQPMRDIEREEFPGMPLLVSYMKIDQKGKVNRAFVAYMNASLVHPFFRRMRIRFFEEFAEFNSLYGEDYSLLYPDNKAFFLVVTMAKHRTLGYRLVWFFYEPASARWYRWTYPQPHYSKRSYHYSQDVIDDIQAISDWNDYSFLVSSRTLDDQRFWSEYVLKIEDGRYRWLEEIPL
jgi:hypothetical protein